MHGIRHYVLITVVGILGLLIFIPPLTYAYFAQDLNSRDRIMNRKDTGVILVDRNDVPFFTFYDAKQKILIPLSDVPEHAREAVIAGEDKGFYRHPGFSIRSIVAAFIANMRKKELAYGGSTITQQLVKNALLKPAKSFLRKYQEAILAFEIERRYTKDEILEMYINSAYFGRGAFGIEEASQEYFGEKAADLSLSQATYLASLLPSPTRLSSNEQQAKDHQKIILERMVEQKYITEEERIKAQDAKLSFTSNTEDLNRVAPHFAIMVRNQLIEKFGEEQISRSGFKVKTTLDVEWQKYAEQVVRDQVARLARNRVTNGAVVVLDPKNGEIRALVGSKDWTDETFGKYNVATAARQPGSAFKPIVYIAGLEKNLITTATVLKDNPTTYRSGRQEYSPKNYDSKFRGDVLVRRALANSLNVPAVAVMAKVGVPGVLEEAKKLGISTLGEPVNYGLSLVLGAGEVMPLELTNVYATFANGGNRYIPTAILEIQDKNKNSIYKYEPKAEQVVAPEYTFLISSILSDNDARGEVFGNALTISRPAAVKTGTTSDYKDAWTVGYTPSLAIGVWVGNNDGKPMDSIAGSLGAAPIWRLLMERFLRGTPVETFDPPEAVVALSICKNSGLLLKEATSSAYREFFIKGTEPTKTCSLPVATPSGEQAAVQGASAPSTPTPESKPQEESEKKDKDKKD